MNDIKLPSFLESILYAMHALFWLMLDSSLVNIKVFTL